MIDIVTLEIAGILPAMHGMRNPKNSWSKNDTGDVYNVDCSVYPVVGPNDEKLTRTLMQGGPEHAKHLRMIMVWADITAPRFWWQEFDTYRIGVEKVSCSTMHKLTAKPLEIDDFEVKDDEEAAWMEANVLPRLNMLMKAYDGEQDPDEKKYIWRKIIHELPQGYLQKRTVMMSYAALRNIYRQRKGHKLYEWQVFREWCEELPESWMITE